MVILNGGHNGLLIQQHSDFDNAVNKSTIQNQTNPFTLSPNQIPESSYNNLSSHMIPLTLAEYNIHEQF